MMLENSKKDPVAIPPLLTPRASGPLEKEVYERIMTTIEKEGIPAFLRKLGIEAAPAERSRPHRNDYCPCGSKKKFGKCCGKGVQEGDPELCQRGKHNWDTWAKVEWSGKWIRSCPECMAIQEAVSVREELVDEVKVILVGCPVCHQEAPAGVAEKAVALVVPRNACAHCGVSIKPEAIFVEHLMKDGVHQNVWGATIVKDLTEGVVPILANGRAARLHLRCFMKVLPHWTRNSVEAAFS